MGYRKFRVDKLFNGYKMLTGHILVTNDDGTVEAIQQDTGSEDAEQLSGVLCPGFVNAHCHLELSHMKGCIPEKTGLVDFVFKVITERHFEKEVMLEAINKAEREMFDNGIVAVGDICNNPLTLLQKLRKNLYYHNFIEASGFIPAMVPERFNRSADLFNAYSDLYITPQGSNSIVPHAPYSVADILFERIVSFPGNRLLTMHSQEAPEENALYQNKSGDFLRLYEKMKIDHSGFVAPGTTSLQACLPYFFPQQTLILVHNVATTAEDLDYIAKHSTPQLYFCLCPNANLYITGMLPPVELFMQHDCKIVLGTDSLASNHQLNILAEMNTLKKHFPHLSYDQMLAWATSNGAKALGIEDKFGSFERGRQPGVLLIDPSFEKVKRIL
jgi:cytosine/adenosine deaminase-related metal-dependent hydrolase